MRSGSMQGFSWVRAGVTSTAKGYGKGVRLEEMVSWLCKQVRQPVSQDGTRSWRVAVGAREVATRAHDARRGGLCLASEAGG